MRAALRFACVAVLWFAGAVLPALAQESGAVHEWTLDLPDDVTPRHTLCEFAVLGYADSEIIASMRHEAGATPLVDGQVLVSGIAPEYSVRIVTRGGRRMAVVEAPYLNRFRAAAGFCAPGPDTEGWPDSDLFRRVTGVMTGGSPLEADRGGDYDGWATVWVDICGGDDRFEEHQRIQRAFESAAENDPEAIVQLESYEDWDRDDVSYLTLSLVTYRPSVRDLAERVAADLAKEGEFEFIPGDRSLVASSCERDGLWVRVTDAAGKRLWSEEFSGFRLMAMRKDAGNILILYAAGIDSIYLNLYGPDRGEHPIGAAPGDGGDPDRSTYGVVHFGGTVARPLVARSTGGELLLKSDSDNPGRLNGRFRFSAVDGNGEPRIVIGGFRNLQIRE